MDNNNNNAIELMMEKVECLEYLSRPHPYGEGTQVIIRFANGYGASVVRHDFSYGVELAVLDSDGKLTYDTPVTNDVLGYLTPTDLLAALRAIAALPKKLTAITESSIDKPTHDV